MRKHLYAFVLEYLKVSPGATFVMGKHRIRTITFTVDKLILVAWTQTRTHNQFEKPCYIVLLL